MGRLKTRDWKTTSGGLQVAMFSQLPRFLVLEKGGTVKSARLENLKLGTGKGGTELQGWKTREKACVDSQLLRCCSTTAYLTHAGAEKNLFTHHCICVHAPRTLIEVIVVRADDDRHLCN